jgi:superfamily II DNA/RNA helicase
MHVVLGLEPNAKEDEMPMREENNDLVENEVDLPQLLVTFEGSARGLHFDGVDVVFVVGRPTSAASYLHLSGRVGRSMAADSNSVTPSEEVEVRPGTIISFCSRGRVTELEKWTNQIGGTSLQELQK